MTLMPSDAFHCMARMAYYPFDTLFLFNNSLCT